MNAVVKEEKALLKLNLGSGPSKIDGFTNVDSIKFDGVDLVFNIGDAHWPLEDSSVSEAVCSHALEHLTNLQDKWERVHFFNELYRVMAPGEYDAAGKPIKGFVRIVLPHWCSNRYYGDPTHKEPFSEFAVYYLDPEWRAGNAPHTDIMHNPNGYSCHWACSWDFTLHPSMNGRNAEYVQHAATFWKEACSDLIIVATAVKKAPD
jgi:hypothetical protein